MMLRLISYIDKLLSTLLVLSASLMIGIVMLQVLSRFALPWSFHWTEELARFCFIYMVSLGAGLALKDRCYVGVEFILNRLSAKSKRYLELLILFATGILMVTMFLHVFPLLQVVRLHFSPALQINMAWMYASTMIMSFSVLLYCILLFIEKLRQQ